MLRRLLYLLPVLIVLALPAGCASDNELPDDNRSDKSTVRFSIRALPSNLATRADGGTPVSPDIDKEKINDWWMVFVDKTGTIVKKIYRSGANPDNYSEFEPAEHSGTGAIEEETFECEIPAGTYTVYAFANITPVELTSYTKTYNTETESYSDNGLSFDDRLSFDDNGSVNINNIDKTAWENANLNLWNKETNIPMSGKQSIIVTNRIEESFSIEVVRVVAKIEFRFTNPTGEDVTINSVSINPITTSKVSLFPDYTAIGDHAYTPLAGSTYKELTYYSNISVPKRNNEEDGINNLYFYCKESISNMANEGRFTVGISMTRKGVTNFVQYNVTSDIKEYINRNDWIVIPITLTDYAVKVDALFYPPIGGYPVIQSKEDIDGAYYFTFGTQGEFSINPYVVDLSKGPNAYLAPERYTIEIGDISYVGENENIFKETPTLSTITGEILGTLGEAEGTACIPLTIKVKDGVTSDKETIYSRVVYIIRKNGDTGTEN